MIKNYSTAVVNMHQKLKSLASKLEQNESSRKGSFRKVRKAMEKELDNMKSANEDLLNNCASLEDKHDQACVTVKELRSYNDQLIDSRNTQQSHV